MTRSLKLRTGYGHPGRDRALHGALGDSMHDGGISFYGDCNCFGIKQNPFFFIKNVKPLGANPSFCLFARSMCGQQACCMLLPCCHHVFTIIRLTSGSRCSGPFAPGALRDWQLLCVMLAI